MKLPVRIGALHGQVLKPAPPPDEPLSGRFAGRLERSPSTLGARSRYALRFAVIVIPTLVAAVYYGFIATPMYTAETRFVVRSEGESGNLAQSFTARRGTTGANAGIILYEFLRSPNAAVLTDIMIGLRSRYAIAGADRFSRLAADASDEALFRYYERIADITLEPSTQVVTIRVRAFTANDAKALADALFELSEQKIGEISRQQRDDTLAFARQELRLTERRLIAAQQKIVAYQARTGELDPGKTADTVRAVMDELNLELAKTQAELSASLSVLKPSSPQVKAMEARIRGLEAQFAAQRAIIGDDAGGGMTPPEMISGYQRLILEKEFAQQAYATAKEVMAEARKNAELKQSYVVRIVSAVTPETATEPRWARETATVFLVSLIVYAFISLALRTVTDQLMGP